MTHAELVQIAAKFAKNFLKCPIVFTEPVTGRESPDVIAFKSGLSFLIECKTSAPDFERDKKKWFRRREEVGMGNFRYFLVPSEILPFLNFPTSSKWGLIAIFDGKAHTQRVPGHFESNRTAEANILLSCLRRMSVRGIVSFREMRKRGLK